MISVVHTTGDRLTRKLASMTIPPGAPQASHAPRDKPDPAPAARPAGLMDRPPEGPKNGGPRVPENGGSEGSPGLALRAHGEVGRRPPSSITRSAHRRMPHRG